MAASTVEATIHTYNDIQKNLLPTPSKSHYTFNLRDISKVFQGMLQVTADFTKTGADLIRLWAHEGMRVFHDRLIDENDRTWFKKSVAAKCKQHFNLEWDKVKGPNDIVMYGNFIDPKSNKKPYVEIVDRTSLETVMASYLEDFNAMTNKPMNLVSQFRA
jgi:dynein heavy chain